MALKLGSDGETFVVRDADLGVADPDPEVTYTVRAITRSRFLDILAKRTSKVLDRASRQMVDHVDGVGANEDALEYALVSWTGINADGEPAPCTREWQREIGANRAAALLQIVVEPRRDEVARAKSFRGPA